MSYLSFPRMHFAGTFYTDPGSLNNATGNFNKARDDQTLDYHSMMYKKPKGVAQYWFEACQVVSVVGEDGRQVVEPDIDCLVGARVDTVNYWDAQTDADGNNYIIGKIADLDPDMQMRSEIYGWRVFVSIPSGGGLNGYLPVPQVRDLSFVRTNAGIDGLQVAVGTWHQKLHVESWKPPETPSPVFAALRAQAPDYLDVKLTVDMYQIQQQYENTIGNRFNYGRVMATIGPSSKEEPQQIVPGRRLYAIGSFDFLKPGAKLSTTPLTREAGEECATALAQAPVPVWNNTDCQVVTAGAQTSLVVDMGGCPPLIVPSAGLLNTNGTVEFGYLDDANTFQKFANQGAFGKPVNEQLSATTTVSADAQGLRQAQYLINSGVVQIALSDEEVIAITNHSLAVKAGGQLVIKENEGGYYVNVEAASNRVQFTNAATQQLAQDVKASLTGTQVQPNYTRDITLVAYQYGRPFNGIVAGGSAGAGQLAITMDPQQVKYRDDNPEEPYFQSTEILSVSLGKSNGVGQYPLTVTPRQQVDIGKTNPRYAMDSVLCHVEMTSSQALIGENQGSAPPVAPALTVLYWQNNLIASSPDWDTNIGPILKKYARLYPGMTDRLDIGDERTVKANLRTLIDRFTLEVTDPAFMPVIRDMSPATIDMIVKWLKRELEQATGDQV